MNTFQEMQPRSQAPVGGEPFHQWGLEEDGAAWLSFYRQAGGFLLRFPDLADFAVPADGSGTTCWPVPGTDAATLEHLYLNQVLPLMRSVGGNLVFHASAVEADGAALAFLGPSGRGKSTLAASFARSGQRFLTDDMLELSRDTGGRLVAAPSHPSIRMWDDSREAVVGQGADAAPAIAYTDKSRLLAMKQLPHCPEPLPLQAAFFLDTAETETASFRRLCGADAIAAWMENVFLLDVQDPARIRSNLAAVAGIAAGVPSIVLTYPRCYSALPDVRHAILSEAATAAGAP